VKNSQLKDNLLLATYAIGLVFLVFNYNMVLGKLGWLLDIVKPFVYGFILAYLLNRPLGFFQRKVYEPLFKKQKRGEKLSRTLALITTYLAVFVLIAALFSVVLPQLISSAYTLVENVQANLSTFEHIINQVAALFGVESQVWEWLGNYWKEIWTTVTNFVANSLPRMVDTAVGIGTGVANLFVGFVVSIYLLTGKEKLILQSKRLLYALLPQRPAAKILEIGRMANATFGGFITGQLTDAAILGCLCFVSMTLLKMPYALLASVIVGITNMIPFFGPFIGAVPCTFIILVNDPIKAVWFVVLMVVLQQVDGNIISPRVVGSSVGLSGLWVLFAIMIGGSLFGLPGMMIGLPTFAVIYTLLRQWISYRLKEKRLDPSCPEAPPAPAKDGKTQAI